MDFSIKDLDDDTLAFWHEVREWFDEVVTEDVHEEERRTGAGGNRKVHQALGKKGWIFPTWAVEDGGAGLDPFRASLISLELNLHKVPYSAGLSTTTLVAPALLQWWEGEIRREFTLGAARGEILFCLGYTEPDGGSDLASVRTRATRDGDEWVINGSKMFTTGAQNGDYAFSLIRSDPSLPKHRGLTMFMVPLRAPGVEIQAVHTMGGERTNAVFFDDVRVPDSLRVGPENQGWGVLHGPLNREHSMTEEGPKPLEEEAGVLSRARSPLTDSMDAVVAWARQPDHEGRRPINDPRIRARLAEIEMNFVAASLTPGPPGRVIRAETFIQDTANIVDLVGPDALISYGQPGAISDGIFEYAHRFAQGTAIYGGTTDVMRNMIAEKFLGMPRNRPLN